ncbi:DNA primase [Streptomyces sulfonofaciens]|uniref:DNA primase n=1 Tax=Streptomyces sulfonofaciens TaxID=68272 RepID=A0A919FQ48_9ACTN|nr:DNA primase [Streptomyces sulfonofaciens]
MREILGRRRRLLPRWTFGRKNGKGNGDESPVSGARTGKEGSGDGIRSGGRKGRPDMAGAALTFATEWQWPVLPGVALQSHRGTRGTRCACPDPECAVPGAHPFDPGLLAASTDERMVRWWWSNRPTAPVVMATGGRAPCAVSLPAVAAARALAVLDQQDIRLGPVVATPTRWAILVAPYSMEQLGALLYAKDFVPGSLRFHGTGGYIALPPSPTGQGQVRWERAPLPGSAAPWVPDVEAVVDAVVDALTHRGVSAPEM